MEILNKLRNSDSSIILTSNLVIAILNFSITIFLTKILGQEQFGTYVIISSFILLLQVLFGFRTGEAILNFITMGTKKDDKINIIKELLLIDAFTNLILFVIIIIFGYFYAINQSIPYSYILGIGLVVIANIGLSIFENLYIVSDQIVKMHKIKLIAVIILFTLVLSFGYLWKLEGVIAGMIMGALIKNVLHFYYIRNEIIGIKVFLAKNTFSHLNDYFLFFKHAYLSTTFKAGSQGLDIFLLSLVFGNEKIALYEVGKKFSQIPGIFIGSIWTSKSKFIVELAQMGDEKNLYTMIKKVYKILVPLGLFCCFIFFLTGEDIIRLIFGKIYLESFPVALVFFIFFWFGNLFGGFGRVYLIAINRPNILTYLNGLMFFNVLFIGYFTKYNLVHMALTICITILFNSLYLNYFLVNRIGKLQT